MDLSSRWLDLDRLAGATEGAAPIDSIAKFAAWMRDLLPGRRPVAGEHRHRSGQSRRRDHRRGTAVADAMGRQARDRRAARRLPGGSRLELKGDIAGPQGRPRLQGPPGLARNQRGPLHGLGHRANGLDRRKGDGAFGVRAQTHVGAGQLTVQDLVGNLSGTTLNGQRHLPLGRAAGAHSRPGKPAARCTRLLVPAGTSLATHLRIPGARAQARPTAADAGRPGWRGAT